MDPAVIISVAIAVIVAIFSSITAPLILAQRTERMHREDREAAWARQDEADKRTNGKLDAIHTIVDGAMTAAMQSELDAVVRELAMMREVIDLKMAAGHKPSADALAAVDATLRRIGELREGLRVRAKAMDAATKQAERRTGDKA